MRNKLVLAGLDEGKRPASFLLRNGGSGTFTDISIASGIALSRLPVSVVPTDFDNRRDIDVFATTAIGGVLLFRNLRDGTFRDVAQDVGLAQSGDSGISAAAVADVNKDGYPDFFVGRATGVGTLAMSEAISSSDIPKSAKTAPMLDAAPPSAASIGAPRISAICWAIG